MRGREGGSVDGRTSWTGWFSFELVSRTWNLRLRLGLDFDWIWLRFCEPDRARARRPRRAIKLQPTYHHSNQSPNQPILISKMSFRPSPARFVSPSPSFEPVRASVGPANPTPLVGVGCLGRRSAVPVPQGGLVAGRRMVDSAG